jgi:hypothetical protein
MATTSGETLDSAGKPLDPGLEARIFLYWNHPGMGFPSLGNFAREDLNNHIVLAFIEVRSFV